MGDTTKELQDFIDEYHREYTIHHTFILEAIGIPIPVKINPDVVQYKCIKHEVGAFDCTLKSTILEKI